MSSPKKPETPVRIESESTFREKVGLTGSPIALEWKKDQVLETTEGALTKLRDELSGKESADEKRKTAEEFLRSQEQSEASGSIEDKLEKAISTGVTDKLKASGIAVGVAAGATAVVHQLDSQIEKTTGVKVGLKESLREWFKEAMNDNTFYLGFLWKALYHAFGGKDNFASQPQQEETGVSLSEHEKASGRHAASKTFEKLYEQKKVSDNSLQAYYVSPELLSKTPKELEGLKSKGKTNSGKLASELGFKELEGDKVLQAIELLLSDDTRKLMKGFSVDDSENTPIGKLFSSMARYMDFIENMRKKGTNLEIKDMGFMDGFDMNNLSEFVGEKKEMLNGLKVRFTGFTPKILSILHTEYTRKTIGEKVEYDAVEKRLNPEEIKFLRETLPEYAKSVPTLIRSFSFKSAGANEAIEEFLKKNPIYYNELIDIFVLSGGKTDMNSMNAFEKSQVLTRIFLMIRHANGSEAYKFIGSLTGGLFTNSSDMTIPSEVKMILKDVGGIFQQATIATAKEFLNIALGFFKLDPSVAVGGMATFIGLMFLAWKLTPVGRAVSTFIWLVTAVGLGGAVIGGYKLSDDGKKVVDAKSGKVALDVDSTLSKFDTKKS